MMPYVGIRGRGNKGVSETMSHVDAARQGVAARAPYVGTCKQGKG